MAATTNRFTFPGADGAELSARLDRPAGHVRATALFAHCFTCSKDLVAAHRIAEGLTAKGYAVVRFDFTGLGGSEGEFANTDFSSNVGDLVAAADHMRAELGAPTVLIGHSLGGAAILAAAGRIPEARAVVTIGAPADPAHVLHSFGTTLATIEADGEAEVTLAGRAFTIRRQFVEDVRAQALEEATGKLRKALLICHAPLDEIVGIDHAAAIFKAAKHPKSFLSLDGADHLLSRREDATYVAEVIAAWACRYLEAADESDRKPPRAMEGSVAVAETGTGRFTNTIVTGHGHAIRADEPLEVGGDDTGATPYDLLLAALGACKTMTMRMYAERKGYALNRAEVRLKHRKIHAEDCAECESESGLVERIDTEIALEGDLSEDERQAIFHIAERCPVHRTLTGEIVIAAELEE